MCSMSVSDRTLHVLLDHLRDLELPTMLARMADQSPAPMTILFAVQIPFLHSPSSVPF